MPFDEEELDPRGECRHEINRLREALISEQAVSESGEQERLKQRAVTSSLRTIIYKMQMPENLKRKPQLSPSTPQVIRFRPQS